MFLNGGSTPACLLTKGESRRNYDFATIERMLMAGRATLSLASFDASRFEWRTLPNLPMIDFQLQKPEVQAIMTAQHGSVFGLRNIRKVSAMAPVLVLTATERKVLGREGLLLSTDGEGAMYFTPSGAEAMAVPGAAATRDIASMEDLRERLESKINLLLLLYPNSSNPLPLFEGDVGIPPFTLTQGLQRVLEALRQLMSKGVLPVAAALDLAGRIDHAMSEYCGVVIGQASFYQALPPPLNYSHYMSARAILHDTLRTAFFPVIDAMLGQTDLSFKSTYGLLNSYSPSPAPSLRTTPRASPAGGTSTTGAQSEKPTTAKQLLAGFEGGETLCVNKVVYGTACLRGENCGLNHFPATLMPANRARLLANVAATGNTRFITNLNTAMTLPPTSSHPTAPSSSGQQA